MKPVINVNLFCGFYHVEFCGLKSESYTRMHDAVNKANEIAHITGCTISHNVNHDSMFSRCKRLKNCVIG